MIASALAEDVRAGLAGRPKSLPPKYFYDALGSLLFEAIGELPWYRITRAEKTLLAEHGADLLSPLGPSLQLVELGGGNGEKLEILLRGLPKGRVRSVALVDLSAKALSRAGERFVSFPEIAFAPHQLTFEEGLVRALEGRGAAPVAVLFLGSNLGNLDEEGALAFLVSLRARLRGGDGLLLGADLVKPEGDLLLAYDDPLGVTAAFDKNVLQRINAELGARFDLATFEHRAVWNEALSRVEMHLVARTALRVEIPGAGVVAEFENGEPIVTEWSSKYDPEGLARLLREAGFSEAARRVDDDARFLTGLFVAS